MSETVQLHITGMDCADCALKLERSVSEMDAVSFCQVNFATASMKIEGDAAVNANAVIQRVQSLGYDVVDSTEAQRTKTGWEQLQATIRQPRNVMTLIGVGCIALAFAIEGFSQTAPALAAMTYITPILLLLGGFFGLYYPVKLGFSAIRHGQGLDMNVLMSIATISAFAIGEFAEAATIIVLFSLGEALEGYTMERARNSIRGLTELAPARATVLTACQNCAEHIGQLLADGIPYESGSCPWCGQHEQDVPVESLAVGDIIVVKPGERIPMDGHVLSGQSAVNQAPITGESMPVQKSPASDVFAGSINGDGLLEIEVTRLAADNTLSRLIYLVEEAQGQKTPTQRFVDKFSRVYTPIVVVAAALIATVPPLLFNQPFLDTPDGRGWLYRALTLLVIACPCALVIATPVAVVSGISTAAKRGVLIKGGAYLEALGRLKILAFDKTGTLTQGQPEVVNIACVDACCDADRQRNLLTDCDHCDAMLAQAAAIERYSTHPLAQAIVSAADARSLTIPSARNVENLPGHGVRGQINGNQITVGNHALLHQNCAGLEEFHHRVEASEAGGKTTVLIETSGELRGFVAVSDPPRQSSRQAIAALQAMGIEQTVMLTGDNQAVAEAIAADLGISDVRAGLLPEDKIGAVRELLAENGDSVGMVGDGVNDAPALAAASVGIAMGAGGSAQALEAADVALMADDLLQLPFAINLGRRAANTIRFNIWFALVVKALFLTAALFGEVTLWMAVFADMGTSLLVTLNGMRLLRAGKNSPTADTLSSPKS